MARNVLVKDLLCKALSIYESEGLDGLSEFIGSLSTEEKKALKAALSAKSLNAVVFKIREFAHQIKMGPA